MDKRIFELARGEAPKTIADIALKVLGISNTQFKRMKFHQGILVDGVQKRSDYRLKPGEKLELVFYETPQSPVKPGTEGLLVVYEDEQLIICDKPAPLPSLAGIKCSGETLQNRVFDYLGQPDNFVYRPINRLDKGTSGLMLIAKNAHIQYLMQKRLHTPDFIRDYIALTEGIPDPRQGQISLPLMKPSQGVKRYVSPSGKACLTDYDVFLSAQSRALVKLRLGTGRTHQIRAHLSGISCPIVGDWLYGREDAAFPGRFALHSARICFLHPLSGQRIESEVPPPDSFAENLF